MKKYLILSLVLLSVLNSCNSTSDKENNAFEQYKNSFIDSLWKLYPDWATSVGYHNYDSLMYIPSTSQREKEKIFFNKQLNQLQQFDYSKLSETNKIDYKIVENFFQYSIWQIEQYKSWEWNPADYNVGSTFYYILSENYATLRDRIQNFYKRLKDVPTYYEAAKQNIKNPSDVHLKLAISQNEGTLSIFETSLKDSLNTLTLNDSMKNDFLKRNEDAINAIKSYIRFLQNFKNEHPRSFRLGATLYEDKFKYEIQSAYTADEIYQAALNRKKYLHEEMGKLARQLWKKYFHDAQMPNDTLLLIRKVIDTISVQHVKPEDFKSEIERQLPLQADFVRKKNLLYMDPNKPLKVRNEPGFMAGVAGASMSSPGPYEKNGTSYYNVGTLDGWSAEKAESYLREYNKYVLQILNIHEAIPGHYVQLMFSNQSPSIIKSILGNGAMIEGWAVYAEYMMMENGYGNGADSAEFWLMYYKWNLRTVCNAILDIGVHTKNMSEAEALDLLTRQAFQQQAEAEGKWNRVQVTNVQLTSYFTGFYEILQLREAYQKEKKEKYSLKEFNETFLSFGSAPIKYIREMMLGKD
ncbi:MAG: DUF885 domain-containing protein [Bacteroidetes bacterium]|nr:DUF885 domain-containing protein [Bacteroidota bacterium]